jgi:hypothetical protein
LTRSEVLKLVRNSFTTGFLPASTVSSYLAELDAKAESMQQQYCFRASHSF